MAYDAADGVIVLFGGAWTPTFGGALVFGDTWIYRAGTWTNLTAQLLTAPSPRTNAAMVYDPVDGYVVMFGGGGGANANTPLNDTWVFHNLAWTKLTPSVSPPEVRQPGATWDEGAGNVLLFGGATGPNETVFLNETWTFLHGAWTRVSTTGAVPFGRNAAGMAYDARDHYTVLFGGWNGTDRFNDTWTYLNGTWTPVLTPSAPSPRLVGGLAYDPQLSRVVTFGGKYLGNFYQDTWTFQGGKWSLLNPLLVGAPYFRASVGMTYLPEEGVLFMFGGETFFPGTLNDTWVFTIPWETQYQIDLSAIPSRCPIDWSGTIAASGTTVMGPAGNYTAFAPQCSNLSFDRWTSTGGVRVSNSTSPVTAVEVSGDGSLEALYTPAYAVRFGVSPSVCGDLLFNGVAVQPNRTLSVALGEDNNLSAPLCSGEVFSSWVTSGLVGVSSVQNASVTFFVHGAGNVTAVYQPPAAGAWTPPGILWLGCGLAVGLAAGAAIGLLLGRRRKSRDAGPAPGSGGPTQSP